MFIYGEDREINKGEVRDKGEGKPECCKSPLLERGVGGGKIIPKEVSRCLLDVEG
jgi:hypothetical protein